MAYDGVVKISKSLAVARECRARRRADRLPWPKRLLLVELDRTTDVDRVVRSPFTWGRVREGEYVLRPVGVLNGLFGFTMWVPR